MLETITYIVHASFFSGNRPEGETLAAGLVVQVETVAPLLPTLGTSFLWHDIGTGRRFTGRVVFAGPHEYLLLGDHLTINVQINLVDSVEILPEIAPAPAPRQIDPGLVGLWSSENADPLDIRPDGEVFSLTTPTPYEISSDRTLLRLLGGTHPVEFTRLPGQGTDLTGLWVRTQSQTGTAWREEICYRDDGSFTRHTSRDGQFHDEVSGFYTDTGAEFTARERRAHLTSGPEDFLAMAHLFGPLETGTYNIAPDGQSWTFDKESGDVLFTKVA